MAYGPKVSHSALAMGGYSFWNQAGQFPTENHVKKQDEEGHLWTKQSSLRRNQPCQHLDLGLLASKTVKNKFTLFKPLSLFKFLYGNLSKPMKFFLKNTNFKLFSYSGQMSSHSFLSLFFIHG